MSLSIQDLPSSVMGGAEAVLPPNESTALLALYQNAKLQQKLYISGQLSLQVPTTVLFTLHKLRYLCIGVGRKLAKEHQHLLELLGKVQCVEIVGVEGEARSVDCIVFPEVRSLLIRKLIVHGLINVGQVVSLNLVEAKLDCPLHELKTIRSIAFDRSPVPTRMLPHIAYSLRWMKIALNPAEFQGTIFKPPLQEDQIQELMAWEALTNVEIAGTRVPFTKLDSSWERLVNLTTLTLSNLEIRSLKHLEILQRCVNLLSLNLSNNHLHTMEYITTVAPNVLRLNVNFNVLESLDGVSRLQKLKHLMVEGNQIDEWCEIRDLAGGCPQLQTLQFSGNPMINKFTDLDDVVPFTASIFNFRPLLVDGVKSESFKGKVTAEFIAKYIPMFERYRGGAGDTRSSDGGDSDTFSNGGTRVRSGSRRSRRSRVSAGGSIDGARLPRKRKVIRGQVQVDKKEEAPKMPEPQLDFDDRHQTEFTNRKVDPVALKEQLGDKWLQQVSAMRAAQKTMGTGGKGGDRFANVVKAVVAANRSEASEALAPAAPAEKKEEDGPKISELKPATKMKKVVKRVKKQSGSVAASAAPPTSANNKLTAPEPASTTTGKTVSPDPRMPSQPPLRTAGMESFREKRDIDSLRADKKPAKPIVVQEASPTAQQSSGGAAPTSERPVGGDAQGPSSLRSSVNRRDTATKNNVPSPTTPQPTPQSMAERRKNEAAAREQAANRLPRQSPKKPPIPLLQIFLDSLASHDWFYIENDQRQKAFPSGASIFTSAICEENDRLWGVAESLSPSKPSSPTGGGDPSLPAHVNAVLDMHPTALEMLIHDTRDGSHNFGDRHYQKTLVRVVETHSGTTRYVGLEATVLEERNGVPVWNGRPLLTVSLEADQPTQPLDAMVDVVPVEVTRGSKSTRQMSDRFDSEGAFDVAAVGRDVFRVTKQKLLAGFIVPRGHIAEMFIKLLKQQLISCHDRLCTAGIMKEWPLHLDDAVVSKDRDRSVPVQITIPYIQERVAKHMDEDISRQRVGSQVIVSGDELRLNLKSYIFVGELSKEAFLCTLYANLVTDPVQYTESAMLVIMTNNFLLIAADKNYHGGSRNPDETFVIIQRVPLSIIQTVEVSFNLQSIKFEVDSLASYVLHTRDAGNTLSLLSALQQATTDTSHIELNIEPCAYASITKAPLIFSVALFMRPPGRPMKRKMGDSSFPARHLREVLDPITLVITSTEIVLMDETDVLTDMHTTMDVIRRPIQSVVGISVASSTVFPLIFAIDSNDLEKGRRDRWIFVAQHPNTVAFVFTELKSHISRLQVNELTQADYERGIVN